MARLQKEYKEKMVPEIMKQLSLKNRFQVPEITKMVINMGIGDGAKDFKAIEEAMMHLSEIVGQKPIVTRAKKSIAGFKLREGATIGCKVTLRKKIMYEFLDRLINVALPRIRDFRGVPKTSFDGKGNYSLGLKEQVVFPEVNLDKVKRSQGMDITIVTTAKDNESAKVLLEHFGMPFEKEGKN
ncbi:50S ribosomal protein L5 [Chlamydiota bacterium]